MKSKSGITKKMLLNATEGSNKAQRELSERADLWKKIEAILSNVDFAEWGRDGSEEVEAILQLFEKEKEKLLDEITELFKHSFVTTDVYLVNRFLKKLAELRKDL